MGTTIFVGNLPGLVGDDELRRLFEERGCRVVHAGIVRHPATRKPCGFGFVTLSPGADAREAIAGLEPIAIGGRRLVVRPFQSRGSVGPQAFRPRLVEPVAERVEAAAARRPAARRQPAPPAAVRVAGAGS